MNISLGVEKFIAGFAVTFKNWHIFLNDTDSSFALWNRIHNFSMSHEILISIANEIYYFRVLRINFIIYYCSARVTSALSGAEMAVS